MNPKNWPIAAKLGTGFGLIVAMFIAFGAYQIPSLDIIRSYQEDAYAQAEKGFLVERVDSRLEHFQAALAHAALNRDPRSAGAQFRELKADALKDIETLRTAFADRARLVQAFEQAYARLLSLFADELIPLLESGARDDQAMKRLSDESGQAFETAMAQLDSLLSSVMQDISAANQASAAMNADIRGATLGIVAGGSLLAILAAVATSLMITRPVHRLTAYATQVAEGVMDGESGVAQSDELGRLAAAISSIPETLSEILRTADATANEIALGRLRSRCDEEAFDNRFRELVATVNFMLDGLTNYIDDIPMPIMTVDLEYNVQFMNRPGAALGETVAEQLHGTKCHGFFKTDDCNTERCAVRRAMQDKAQRRSMTIARPMGDDIHIDYIALPNKNRAGEVVGAVELVMDITAEKTTRLALERLADQAGELSESLSSMSEELAAQVEQTARGTDEQRQRTTETATAMEEMSATVVEVARNASDSAQRAESTKSNAQEGAVLVGEVIEAVTEVEGLTRTLRESMGDLENNAENIGQIIGVINDIADQTNLLALNAAIEAARAGDAGRGFAVVADEVRKLAEKTMTATREVETAVALIQQGAANNLQATLKAAEAVSKSTAVAEKSGDAMRSIVTLAEETAQRVTAIATASEEQSAVSEEIGRATEEVDRISQETAQAMRDSADAVVALANLAERLNGIIAEMRNT